MKFFTAAVSIFFTCFFLWSTCGFCQFSFEIDDDCANHFFIEIPTDTIGVFAGQRGPFGGISAIEYTGKSNRYILLSDGLPSRYYTFSISIKNSIKCNFQRISYLTNPQIRGEGLRIAGSEMFLTDERHIDGEEKTLVWKRDAAGAMQLIENLEEKYYGVMHENSGFEGICLSGSGDKLYLAMERALPDAPCRAVVPIIEYTLETGCSRELYYPFQMPGESNGISEIASLNDSILLVIERDYLKKENRNTVNLYTININQQPGAAPESCSSLQGSALLQPRFVYSLDTLSHLGGKPFKVNNIEGAALTPDGKYLLLVSDNNFGNRGQGTPTQLLALKVKKF